MRKIFSALVLIGFLAVLVIPMIAAAQEAPNECCTLNRTITLKGVSCQAGQIAAPSMAAAQDCGDTWCNASENNWGMFCLMNTLYGVTDWVFVVLVAVAGIMVILGAFSILTAGGNAEKVTTGRNYIIYAAVGLAVGFLARAIPAIVKMIVGA